MLAYAALDACDKYLHVSCESTCMLFDAPSYVEQAPHSMGDSSSQPMVSFKVRAHEAANMQNEYSRNTHRVRETVDQKHIQGEQA